MTFDTTFDPANDRPVRPDTTARDDTLQARNLEERPARAGQPAIRQPAPPADLPAAEALFVRTFRNLAAGPPAWHAGQQEIWSACSIAHMERVLGGFERVIACLATGARRPMALLPPGSRAVTTAELAALNLVAAAQAGAFGHVTALAQWLVVPDAQARLLSAATRLASALAASGIDLAYRLGTRAGDFRMPPGAA